MRLFDATNVPLLNKALNTYALRQRVSASNMANVTTPGYKSQSVSFEEQLAEATNQSLVQGARTSDRHLSVGAAASNSSVEPTAFANAENPYDGYNGMASGFNDVDIDHEMAELAKNQIRFKFGSRILGDTFKGIQKAIRGTL